MVFLDLSKFSSILHGNYLAFWSFINKQQWGVFVVSKAVVFLQDVVFRNDVLCVHCFDEHRFSDLHIIHMVCLGPMFLSLPLFLALLTLSSVVPIAGSWLQVCEKVPSEWLCGWLVVSSYPFHFGQCSALPDLTCKLIIPPLANVNVVNILVRLDFT